MDIYSSLVQKIVKEQEAIIGPVAIEQASKVEGLRIDPKTYDVTLNGDKKVIIESLVKKYESLFGLTSIEVCRDAVKSMLPQVSRDQIPQILL